MKDYLKRFRKNKTESSVQFYYRLEDYDSLSRGWPDFVFYKKLPNEKMEYIFVEVKRSNQTVLKPAQKKMQKIFKDLGLDYKVCFGLKDGKPNFRNDSI